jgi:hypothetical protein
LLVARDCCGFAAADDGEGGGGLATLEVFGREVLCYFADVVFAVLVVVSVDHMCAVCWLLGTHSAEEVSDEYHHRSVFCVIELFKLERFATLVEDFEVAGFLERLLVWLGAAFARLCGHGGCSDVGDVAVMVSMGEMMQMCFSGSCCMTDRYMYR